MFKKRSILARKNTRAEDAPDNSDIVVGSSAAGECLYGVRPPYTNALYRMFCSGVIEYSLRQGIEDYYLVPLFGEHFDAWAEENPNGSIEMYMIQNAKTDLTINTIQKNMMDQLVLPYTLIFSKPSIALSDSAKTFTFSMSVSKDLSEGIQDIISKSIDMSKENIYVSRQVFSLPALLCDTWDTIAKQATDYFLYGERYTRHEFDEQVVSRAKYGFGWSYFAIPVFLRYKIQGNCFNLSEYRKVFAKADLELKYLSSADAIQTVWSRIDIEAKPIYPCFMYPPMPAAKALNQQIKLMKRLSVASDAITGERSGMIGQTV